METRNSVRCVFFDAESLRHQFPRDYAKDFVACMERAYRQAAEYGARLEAVLLCNPHNPVGQCYDREVLGAIMKFCHQDRLHLIFDEIYTLSAFAEPFTSVLSIPDVMD